MGRTTLRLISLLLVLLLFSSLGFTSAVSDDDSHLNTIKYALPYDFSEYSPFTSVSYATAQWISMVYSGLYQRDNATMRWIPELAVNAPEISNNGKTYTVKLRQGLQFSNGNDLTTEDVKFTYLAYLNPDITSSYYSDFVFQGYGDENTLILEPSQIEIVDDITISFTFREKNAFVMQLLSLPITDKSQFASQYDDCLDGKAPCTWNDPEYADVIGAGPFVVDRAESDNTSITLYPNPYYHRRDEIKTQAIILEKIPEKSKALAALKNNSIEIMDSQYVPGYTELTDISNANPVYTGEPSHQEFALNHLHPYFGTGEAIPGNNQTSEQHNFDDAVILRQAMSYVVNRDNFVDEILRGIGDPAATVVPHSAIGWDSSLKPYEFNISHAKELMTSIGFDYQDLGQPDEEGMYLDTFFNFTMYYPVTCPARNSWNPIWKQDLAKIGINLELVGTGWDTIIPRTFGYESTESQPLVPTYENGGFDALSIGYSWDLEWNPKGLYDTSGRCDTGSCANFYNFDVNATHTEIDELVSNYTTTLDMDTRIDQLRVIQQQIYKYIPTIPILHPGSLWGINKDVKGLNPVLLSMSLQDWTNIYVDGEYSGAINFSDTNQNTLSFHNLSFLPLALVPMVIRYLREKHN